MKLVMFCHPGFLTSQSMPRFARLLKTSYETRGYEVEVWSPRPKLHRILAGSRFAKWGGYIDQYLLFPLWVRKMMRTVSDDTLFVFCDQALGPWIPLVKERPHVVHVHDLLALRSALGELEENPTSISGRIYQRYIRWGFSQARHFISVSKKTRDDLHRFGQISAITSEYVYNGLNFPFSPLRQDEALQILLNAKLPATADGMVLHVGGGQWYKNLPGVIAIYAKYAARDANALPLWCIGPNPRGAALAALEKVPSNGRVLFFSRLDNLTLQAAYSVARVFLFPSLAEGFGWPLIEARACGCPVITTDEAPMNEFPSEDSRFIPRMGLGIDIDMWAELGASLARDLIAQRNRDPAKCVERAQAWAKRFDADKSIDAYLSIYEDVFRSSTVSIRQRRGLPS
jgi:glycosyltransferase involved in cell wall biosynthesis